MPSTLTRRPLPAVIALLALLLLTGLVWWRVLHRNDTGSAASTCPTPTTSAPAVTTLPAPASVTVQVLNSTSRTGIAARARTLLTDAGFQSPAAATNDPGKKVVKGVAEIRYGAASANAAKLVALYLPGATLVPTAAKSPTVVISLGLGYRTVAPARTVAAELAKQHLTTQSPSPTASSASC